MTLDWLKPEVVLGSTMYAVIGVVIFWLSFIIVDKITPYKLWEELVEHKNIALAIVVGAMCLSIGNIVAAAIHG
jgi:putative membrane protein